MVKFTSSFWMVMTSLFITKVTSSSSPSSSKAHQSFMEAMRQNESNTRRRQQAAEKLTSKLLQHAKPYNPNRHLANNNNNNNNNDDDNDQYSNYGFDLSSYALKYASCSAISTYSDNLAQNEDSSTVFYTQQYVIFRLCPSDTCKSSSTTSGDGTNNNRYGCMSNYGEYMIPLYDWLDLIREFREDEMERYCDYCKVCKGDYNNGNNNNNNNGGGSYYGYNGENRGNRYYNEGDLDDYQVADDDGIQYNYNNNNKNNNKNNNQEHEEEQHGEEGEGNQQGENHGDRKLGGDDDSNNTDDDDDNNNNNNNNNNGYDCSYADACSGYGDVCYNNKEANWAQFFNCKKIQMNNAVLYIGPHCSKDKSRIVLAPFEDKYCQNYVGDKYDLNTITDDMITMDTLEEYYRSDCISCKESDLPFQKSNNDANDNNDILEMCENLYEYAAKCNRYIGSANVNSYQSYQQANNENAVCSFISSVVQGSYDEYGYIYINSHQYAFDNKYNSFAKAARRRDVVTSGQAFGLLFFSLALVGLTGYAVYMRHLVNEKFGYIPSIKEPLQKRGNDIERVDSGIMMCRSKSNLSYQAPVPDGRMV